MHRHPQVNQRDEVGEHPLPSTIHEVAGVGEQAHDDALEQAVRRNVTLADESRAAVAALQLRRLHAQLAATGDDALLAGELA